MMNTRSYSELMRLETFEERFEYLKLSAKVGIDTFGNDRYLNQVFYRSPEWKYFRRQMLMRDNGNDLGVEDHPICSRVELHHINPITVEQIQNRDPCLLDPENVICVSPNTHKAIHYGDASLLPHDPIERRPNDTCPWKE